MSPCLMTLRALSTATPTAKDVTRRQADIVILGGGMVGSSLACAMAASPVLAGKKIYLLEGAPKKPYVLKPEFSNRVSAVNPSSTKFLSQIGVWPIMEKTRVTPFKKMFVWEDCSNAYIEFEQDEFVGHIVENDVTIHGLTVRMDQLENENKNFQVVYGAKVQDCIVGEDGESPRLTFDNGDILETGILIGADGANSLVRKKLMADASYHSRDYEQFGVVGTVTFDNSSTANETAYQKFLPTGPIALLPLNSTKSSLVWTLPPKTAKELVKFDPQNFAKILNSNLANRKHSELIDSAVNQIKQWLPSGGSGNPNLPKILSVDNVAAFPLGLGLPERYVTKRVALVGDACHRVHPLAGLGVNLGYGDAECLTRKLEENVMQGAAFGSYEHLCEYETERTRHNLPTALTIDGIQRLYSTNLDLVVLARSLGTQVVNGIPALKKAIMSSASS